MGKQEKVGLLQGTLDMLILKALQNGPRHGYQITRWIETTSQKALIVEEGSLYPALHRMEQRGWISSQWGRSEANRRAKYYELTRTGRTRLAREQDAWKQMAQAITLILNADTAGA